MKRATAVILTIGILLSFAGCRKTAKQTEISDFVEVFGEIAQSAKDAVKDIAKDIAKEAKKRVAEGALKIGHDAIEFEGGAKLPGFSAAAKRFQSGTMNEADYYQYAALSQKDKQMYRAVVAAIRRGGTVEDISQYGYEPDRVFLVYRAVVTDHPEFFFLAQSFLYTVSTDGKTQKLILLYSDGQKSDEYDKKGNPTVSADRNQIDAQIDEFAKKIAAWKKEIHTDTDLWDVEKQLHDSIIDRVTYDDVAAEQADDPNAPETHAFDTYGAACEGKAVCEGYSKLFQYLCYCYGVNCTTVSGTAKEGDHMWNAVKLNGNWTMIDVTWDDAEEELRLYSYFNKTTKEMEADHRVEEEELAVPDCTSTEGAFSRRFAFSVSSLSDPPDNYEEVIDRLAAGNDTFVCLLWNAGEKQLSRYINRQIISDRSVVRAYIYEAGYDIEFDGNMYIADAYCYLMLE